HALIAVRRDDHEPVSLPRLAAVPSELTNTGEVHRLAVAVADEVGLLLLRVVRILYPLIPAVSGDHASAIVPYRPEELPAGRRLASGIDHRWPLTFCPERLPAPTHQIQAQAVLIPVQYPHLRSGRHVVPINRLRIHASDNWGNNADALQVFP